MVGDEARGEWNLVIVNATVEDDAKYQVSATNFRYLIYNHGVTTRKSLDFCLHIKFNLMVEMILI